MIRSDHNCNLAINEITRIRTNTYTHTRIQANKLDCQNFWLEEPSWCNELLCNCWCIDTTNEMLMQTYIRACMCVYVCKSENPLCFWQIFLNVWLMQIVVKHFANDFYLPKWIDLHIQICLYIYGILVPVEIDSWRTYVKSFKFQGNWLN